LQPEAAESTPVVGFNVSGLMYNSPEASRQQFGLRVDYPRLVLGFLQWLINRTNVRIVLVPHVTTPMGHPESDLEAALQVRARLGQDNADRVAVAPSDLDAPRLKWLIGRTDWFCGTRMHSTIAALGSGVPTVALSYSLKTRGVFDTCGLADNALEMRHHGTQSLLGRLQYAWSRREEDRERVRVTIPRVAARAASQFDEMIDFLAPARPRTEEVARVA
jgi:polysaccharide pyruvyl transferase WcaK-like protein